jgi:DNA primase
MYERFLTDKVIDYFDVGYDEETNCLTFPVSDKHGNVLFVQRRSVGTKFFQFGEDDPKGDTLYGIFQVYKNLSWIRRLWVVESPICALTLWGEREPAVATMGALPTREHLELLRELPIREIILAQDNDLAGHTGRKKSGEFLADYKSLYIPQWIEGIKDINQYVKDTGKSVKTIELCRI